MSPDEFFLRIPLGEGIAWLIRWFKENLSLLFDAFSWLMRALVDGLTDTLLLLPALVMVLLFALLSLVFRSWQFAIATAVLFLFALCIDVWEPMMQTMAQVLVATVCAIVIAVPVGILAATNRTVSVLVRPILDFMQTMPAFVYLIPAIIFFSVGTVPGLFSTIIFALPPGVRMTELGIRQVDSETVEAGESFGATPGQILTGIQLPLAIPTIMAGVNQVIMLSLSMAVISGMVGADGLGKLVVQGITTMNLPLGIEAGVGVVLLAVFLDRLTASLGNPGSYPTSLIALLKKSLAEKTAQRAAAEA
ncbi:ABC transporter permease [Brachybacterium phenoliresistens]|uniref:Glycine/betaine ABC transporter n=1 Tax=Brachybacterium phenoliresistens TaxID=396014 RepID=Z9JPZ7_9MICO|nr:ABC transporter permease subunit [Brachybacterium phenoliresistens]EWS80470.1 glycine/betaine ABC transporter [Brachybacterium phenoliresistens]